MKKIFLGLLLVFYSFVLRASQFDRAKILSIDLNPSANNGKLEVNVAYLLHCGEIFQNLHFGSVPPYSRSNPRIAIEVLVSSERACHTADRKAIAKFEVASVAGFYTFIPVLPISK